MHGTHHFGQHTGKMQIYHQQIATKHTIGNIGIFQHPAQTLNHHHAFGNFRRRFGQGVHLVHSGYGKFHATLLQLQIGSAPTVQQRIHTAEATTDSKTRQRSIHAPKSYGEVRTILSFGFQIVDVHRIQKGFQSFGNFHFLSRLVPQQMKYDFRRIAKVRTRERKHFLLCRRNECTVFLHYTTDNTNILFLYIIAACTVMFLSLYQRNEPTLSIIFLCLRSTPENFSIRQQTEECIELAQLTLSRFKCHINSIFIK